jgi:protease-4
MFETAAGESRLVRVEDYRKVARPSRQGPVIAVVHTAGFVLSGKNGYNPALGLTLGDASAVRDLEDAAQDDDVAAIVLRIDSPGGEIVASDVIGHAVERARAAKPVVVSMVNVAASGGYMMAYRANRIVALPTSITGSIGSFTGKFVLRGLYDKVGLTKDFVTRGTFPLLESDYRDWSAVEESLVVRQHWEDYERWIADIAAHRDLDAAAVDSMARGRVWSGRQAHDRRLVDDLGDLHRAVQLAGELAEISVGATPRLVHYPKPRGLLDLLEERSELFAAFAQHAFRAARLPQGAAWAVLDLRLGR